MDSVKLSSYWRAHLKLLATLLLVWFAVSFVAGILLADWLDARFRIGGFPLGFWFAQQGSIFAFVALVFGYVAAMNRLVRQHGVAED
ncbi:MAG: DUF4212 domain-containing protein [Steroidobacteraceae bacterium]